MKREELLLYRRYIDDLFFIWSGSTLSLQCFLKELNANTNNIRLTSEYSKYDIHFLDVYMQGEKLETKVYFKPTDRNNYLPFHSGHHPMWLRSIPEGQIMRVKRNCWNDTDYISQVQIIKKKFADKGYNERHLDSIVEEVPTPEHN